MIGESVVQRVRKPSITSIKFGKKFKENGFEQKKFGSYCYWKGIDFSKVGQI